MLTLLRSCAIIRIMKVAIVKMCCLVFSAGWAVGVNAEISNPVPVVIDTDAVLQWRTLSENRTTVWFDWPTGAAEADWQVRGMAMRPIASGHVVRAGVARSGSFELVVPAPVDVESESTYSLSVSFDVGAAASLEATVARVRGTGGTGARYVDPETRAWNKVKSSAVLPIAAGTSVITIDGRPVDAGLDGAVGWYGWCPIGAGMHEISQDGADAVAVRCGGGFALYLR